MTECPKCQSKELHRSRGRSRWELWRKEVTGKRPYRCHTCGWRGWSVDTGPRFRDDDVEVAVRAMAPEPEPLNLQGAALARDERLPDLDLEQLDSPAVRSYSRK